MPIDEKISESKIEQNLLTNVSDRDKVQLASFIHKLFNVYVSLHFTYLEVINMLSTNSSLFIVYDRLTAGLSVFISLWAWCVVAMRKNDLMNMG